MQKHHLYTFLNIDMLYVAHWEKVLSITDDGETKFDTMGADIEKACNP